MYQKQNIRNYINLAFEISSRNTNINKKNQASRVVKPIHLHVCWLT